MRIKFLKSDIPPYAPYTVNTYQIVYPNAYQIFCRALTVCPHAPKTLLSTSWSNLTVTAKTNSNRCSVAPAVTGLPFMVAFHST
jgi:hypothetical protein